MVLTTDGTVKSRTVRRLAPSRRHQLDVLSSVKGLPWDDQGAARRGRPRKETGPAPVAVPPATEEEQAAAEDSRESPPLPTIVEEAAAGQAAGGAETEPEADMNGTTPVQTPVRESAAPVSPRRLAARTPQEERTTTEEARPAKLARPPPMPVVDRTREREVYIGTPDPPAKRTMIGALQTEDEDPGDYFDGSFTPVEAQPDESDDPGPLTDDNPLAQKGKALEIERFAKFSCYEVLTEADAAKLAKPIYIKTRCETVWKKEDGNGFAGQGGWRKSLHHCSGVTTCLHPPPATT